MFTKYECYALLYIPPGYNDSLPSERIILKDPKFGVNTMVYDHQNGILLTASMPGSFLFMFIDVTFIETLMYKLNITSFSPSFYAQARIPTCYHVWTVILPMFECPGKREALWRQLER